MKFRNGDEKENVIYVDEFLLGIDTAHLDTVYKHFNENPRKAVFEQWINEYLLLKSREERLNALPILMEILKLPEDNKPLENYVPVLEK